MIDNNGVITTILTNDLADMFSAVAPVAGVILAAVVGWRLFKRFVN